MTTGAMTRPVGVAKIAGGAGGGWTRRIIWEDVPPPAVGVLFVYSDTVFRAHELLPSSDLSAFIFCFILLLLLFFFTYRSSFFRAFFAREKNGRIL